MSLYWLYDLPHWLLGALSILFFNIIGIAGLYLSRGWVRRQHGVDHSHNDIVSYFLGAVVVFYGITLGLLAVGAWTNYAGVEAKVDREAQVIGSLYRDTGAYPAPFNQKLRTDITTYVHEIITVSWPMQQQGQIPFSAGPHLDALQNDLLSFQPSTMGEQVLHAEAFRQYNELIESRRSRLNSVTTHMPRALWTLVILGALITLGVTLFFDTASFKMHLWLTTFLASLLGLMIFLIGTLDSPFRGRGSVSAAPLARVYEQFK